MSRHKNLKHMMDEYYDEQDYGNDYGDYGDYGEEYGEEAAKKWANPDQEGININDIVYDEGTDYVQPPKQKTKDKPQGKDFKQKPKKDPKKGKDGQKKKQTKVLTYEELNEIYPVLNVEEQKLTEKDDLNLCIIGHVDSGKSTLIGNILAQLGKISQQEAHKNKKNSEQLGKASFHHAFVMDQDEEEQERGITKYTGYANFQSKNRQYSILDNPGHKEFIANMITGTVQADCAVLVVDGNLGGFEGGFEDGGQTKEHALLAHSLGITNVVVAINKLELMGWDSLRYDMIKEKVQDYLVNTVKYEEANIRFVPISGLEGINLVQRVKGGDLGKWYKGPCLLEILDKIPPKPRLQNKPVRVSITEVFNSLDGNINGSCVNAKVESGIIKDKMKLTIMPQQETVQISGITVHNKKQQEVGVGTICQIGLKLPKDLDSNMIKSQNVLCDPKCVIKFVDRIRCTLQVFDIKKPLAKGHNVEVFCTFARIPGKIHKFEEIIDPTTGERLKKNPMFIKSGQMANVIIKFDECACFELKENFDQFGTIVLRDSKTTIAKGAIIEFPRDAQQFIDLDDTQRMEAN